LLHLETRGPTENGVEKVSDKLNLYNEILEMYEQANPNTLTDCDMMEVQVNDVVVGKMDDNLKKLYLVLFAVKRAYGEMLAKWYEKIELLSHKPISEGLALEFARFTNKALIECNLFQNLFDGCVRRKFDIYGDVDVEVRKGFKVVYCDSLIIDPVLDKVSTSKLH
jgi:hypothetical protein